MLFDLSSYLIQNANHFFFDEKKYSDLLKDVSSFHSLFIKKNDQLLGLQFESPYLCFAAILGVISAGKTAVLISSMESTEGVKRLKTQVPFQEIFRDSDYERAELQNSALIIKKENPAVIVFSSGSSGLPKGIVLTFDNLYYSALGLIEFVQQKKTEASLMNLPHHHVGGLMTLWRAFFSQGSLVSNPESHFDFISIVPLQLARSLRDEVQLARLKKCRIIFVGGAKLTDALRKEALLADLKIYETYGMSETASLVCLNGEVLPYREVALDDNNYFLIKGQTLATGFYQKGIFEKLPLDKFGRYKTKDVGVKENNHFVFSHRADVVFISGGENINPLLIEDILRSHPDISDAYVLPVEDEQWGQMAICLYEARLPKTFIEENELKFFLKNKIHPYHIPKKFFSSKLSFQGQLKPKRHELIKKAEELYLKNLFSFSFKEKSMAPVLVFLHGFTGNKDEFSQLGKWMEMDFSILTVDLPGHGNTKAEDFFSTSDLLSKLSRFIALFSDRPFLYGYSMGGRVALQLALNYLTPAVLILESAGPGLETKDEADKRRKSDSELFNGFSSTEKFIRHWYEQKLFHQYRYSNHFESDIKNKFSHELSQWQLSQQLLSQGSFPLMHENINKLKSVSFPVVYLYGSEDLKYKAYAPLFKTSYEIQGASHNPHKTHLAEITAILKSILK